MAGIDDKKTGKPPFFPAAMSLALLAGCAASQYGDADYDIDSREELRKLSCPSDTTAACIQRIGQPTRCFCSHRDDLEALLEPPR